MSASLNHSALRQALLGADEYFGIPDDERPACVSFLLLAAKVGSADPPDPSRLDAAYEAALEEARGLVAQGKLSGMTLPELSTGTSPPAPPAGDAEENAVVTDRPFHPAADILPMMKEPDLEALAADIKEHGLREPIWLLGGRIVDGRNRLLACKIAGVEPRFREWEGTGSLVAWIVSVNFHRRHLTDQQRAVVAARTKVEFEKEARERSNENLKQNKGATEGLDPAPRSAGKSAEKAAALLNVSVDRTKKATKVIKDGDPDLLAAVEQETVSLDAAATVAALPKAKQRELVAEGKVKDAAKKVRAKRKASRKAASFGTASEPAAASHESEPTAETRAEPGPTASPSPQAPAKPPKIMWKDVMRVIRRTGPDLARKVINRIASDVDLEVWVASDDAGTDVSGLADLLRHRLEALAAHDFEEAEGRVRSHEADLQEILAAAAPEQDEGSDSSE